MMIWILKQPDALPISYLAGATPTILPGSTGCSEVAMPILPPYCAAIFRKKNNNNHESAPLIR